jgi:hypothetical protein
MDKGKKGREGRRLEMRRRGRKKTSSDYAFTASPPAAGVSPAGAADGLASSTMSATAVSRKRYGELTSTGAAA